MSAGFGVRIVRLGPARLAVLALARRHLAGSPAEVKLSFDSGIPIELARDLSHSEVTRLASELRGLGAEVNIYVTTPCFSQEPPYWSEPS